MSSSANQGDIKSLEYPTVKVPYENLNKKYRLGQKQLEKDASEMKAAASEASQSVAPVASDAAALREVARGQLDALYAKTEALETRVNDVVRAERDVAEGLKRRLDHIERGCEDEDTDKADRAKWKKTRLDRMLVEHFLRSGYYDSAILLSKSGDLADLTNIKIFMVAKEVEEALVERDTSRILAWCVDNRSKLKKMRSSLELDVRLQEFVELVKAGKVMDAVAKARKHLAPATNDKEVKEKVQKAMALLAFPRDTDIPRYHELLQDDRWQFLVEHFRNENYRLFQLSTMSVLSVVLQAGLSSLKTQRCCRPSASHDSGGRGHTDCPVCHDPLFDLSRPLPFAHCSQSRLICQISGEPMNENNPCMMLPNGYVYGRNALQKMAEEADGQVFCPRTQEVFPFKHITKVFVM